MRGTRGYSVNLKNDSPHQFHAEPLRRRNLPSLNHRNKMEIRYFQVEMGLLFLLFKGWNLLRTIDHPRNLFPSLYR